MVGVPQRRLELVPCLGGYGMRGQPGVVKNRAPAQLISEGMGAILPAAMGPGQMAGGFVGLGREPRSTVYTCP